MNLIKQLSLKQKQYLIAGVVALILLIIAIFFFSREKTIPLIIEPDENLTLDVLNNVYGDAIDDQLPIRDESTLQDFTDSTFSALPELATAGALADLLYDATDSAQIATESSDLNDASASAQPTQKNDESREDPNSKIDFHLADVYLVPDKIDKLANETDDDHKKRVEEIKDGKTKVENKFSKNNPIRQAVVVVRNNGHEDVENVLVKLIINHRTIGSINIEKFNQGTEQRLRFDNNGFPEEMGWHKIEAQINPDKKIIERHFDNNSKTLDYQYR